MRVFRLFIIRELSAFHKRLEERCVSTLIREYIDPATENLWLIEETIEDFIGISTVSRGS